MDEGYLDRQRQGYVNGLIRLANVAGGDWNVRGKGYVDVQASREFERRKVIIANEIESRGLRDYRAGIINGMNARALERFPEGLSEEPYLRQEQVLDLSDSLLDLGLDYVNEWDDKWLKTLYLMVSVDTVDTNRPFTTFNLEALRSEGILGDKGVDRPYFKYFPNPNVTDDVVYESIIYIPLKEQGGRTGRHNLDRTFPDNPRKLAKKYISEFEIPKIATTSLEKSAFIGDIFEDLGMKVRIFCS